MGLFSVIKGLSHLPYDEFLRLSKSADVVLATNCEGFSTLIPGKIYEYCGLSGGPPILLLSCPGAASEPIEKYDIGIAVGPYDVMGSERAIYNTLQKYKSGEPKG